jgi:hypothetical protein
MRTRICTTVTTCLPNALSLKGLSVGVGCSLISFLNLKKDRKSASQFCHSERSGSAVKNLSLRPQSEILRCIALRMTAIYKIGMLPISNVIHK